MTQYIVPASIDAHDLMRELHHIAGSEQHDPDVRRTASEAESAIGRLATWVNELQMNTTEREAILLAAACAEDGVALSTAEAGGRVAAVLRGLLKRHM